MSTSLLYHAFQVRGYRHVRTGYGAGGVVMSLAQESRTLCCAACGSRDVIRRGETARQFKTVPIGRRPVTLVLGVPRVECRDCKVTRQVRMGFADPRRRYTKSFARYALELSQMTTIQDAARHLGVSWDVVKEIQKESLQRRFAQPKLKHLRQLAIDEISIGKGHRYLTLVLDLESGAVVYIGEGKGADALLNFWKRLRRSGAQVRAVATDMSPAYIDAVTTHLPGATLVFDRFHVMKLFNDKLSTLRRELYHVVTNKLHKQALKGTRWLLLKRPENLDDKRDERGRLEEALRLNQPLATAYYLKEDLAQVWEQGHRRAAKKWLRAWIARAEASGIRVVMQMGKTVAAHAEGILAYYKYPISTGPLEGTNNKIKTMKRQAYGYRDQDFLKLKILGIHETKYALVG